MKKYTKTLKELVKQRRCGHYTGNKYDLTQATHWYNTRKQGTIVDPTAQNVSLLEINIQGHHQENIVNDPTTGPSLEYRHIIKRLTKAIWENLFANKIGGLAQKFGTRMLSETNTIFFIPKGILLAGGTVTYGIIVE